MYQFIVRASEVFRQFYVYFSSSNRLAGFSGLLQIDIELNRQRCIANSPSLETLNMIPYRFFAAHRNMAVCAADECKTFFKSSLTRTEKEKLIFTAHNPPPHLTLSLFNYFQEALRCCTRQHLGANARTAAK